MGILITSLGTRILVPLNNEKEKLQLKETLQRSTVEKRLPPVPYLENIGPLREELLRMALEEAGKRKVKREAVRAKSDHTSSQGGVPPPKGILVVVSSATGSKTVQHPSQSQPRGCNEIVEEARRRWRKHP